MNATVESVDSGARASVALRDLVVVLGNFPALSGVDLMARPGEIVVLRGPNGAGKTTLLQVCAGLRRPTSGRAIVLGHDVASDARSVRRSVGVLGHAGFLYEDLTVAENVRFRVRSSGGTVAAADASMERFGIDGRVAKVAVRSCSAGQRRRASLAAIAALAPQLWLLDEPHASLDAETRDLVDSTVRDVASRGATVLCASHDDERADAIATRIVHLVGGHVVEDEDRRTERRAESTLREVVHVP